MNPLLKFMQVSWNLGYIRCAALNPRCSSLSQTILDKKENKLGKSCACNGEQEGEINPINMAALKSYGN